MWGSQHLSGWSVEEITLDLEGELEEAYSLLTMGMTCLVHSRLKQNKRPSLSALIRVCLL